MLKKEKRGTLFDIDLHTTNPGTTRDERHRNKTKLKTNLLLQKVSPLTEREDMFQMSLDESNMSSVVERQLRWWF
jgi:hypothetical protein